MRTRLITLLLAIVLYAVSNVAAPTQHSITVQWAYTQGADLAVSFNVYRGIASGGPYNMLNSAPVPLATLSYIDTTGTGGVKYFYVVTAVDTQNSESAYSNEVSGIFLANPAAPAGVTIVVK